MINNKLNHSYYIKTIIICIYLLIIQNYIIAQNTNSWIHYDQKYYKIAIVQEGIYRLYLSDLVGAGIPTGTFQTKNIQLFHNGLEQALYIKGEEDGIFHESDFIEFYANRSNGLSDTVLYENKRFSMKLLI
ncbi:MAG: hypothetical protein IPO21_00440 [Bacteroidales bacterium]|nr:hypothetical protein [Bacteroidales bacterium]